MLALAFFVSVFSTVTWLIYAFLFVSEKLSGIPLNALSLFDASIYAAFMILPVFVLWSIFGYINQYTTNRHLQSNMLSLFKQMKKNMDYTDLVARIMLEAEQEIKDGFILNKFDIFIADMNELLAEILLEIRDVGVVLLIDERFAERRYVQFYPQFWNNLEYVHGNEQLRNSLNNFWNIQG